MNYRCGIKTVHIEPLSENRLAMLFLAFEAHLVFSWSGSSQDLERFLFDKFYTAFCEYHKVDSARRLPFSSFLDAPCLKQFNFLMLAKKFILRAVHVASLVQVHPNSSEYKDRKVGEENDCGTVICLLWPHTFVLVNSPIGPDGHKHCTPLPKYQNQPAALPAHHLDKVHHNLSDAKIPNEERGKIMKAERDKVHQTKQQMCDFWRQQIPLHLPTLQSSEFFFNPAFFEQRRSVDIAIMKMFEVEHNEMCPCCFLSFQGAQQYFIQNGEKCGRPIGSHIYCNFYLANIGAILSGDFRGKANLSTNTRSMKMNLLCRNCDNTMGDWEGNMGKRKSCCSKETCSVGPCYVDASSMSWLELFNKLELPDGAVEWNVDNERTYFRFLIPNIYRTLLLSIDETPQSQKFHKCTDMLRQYMHAHLLFPSQSGTPSSFYMYLTFISVHSLPGVIKRWLLTDSADSLIQAVRLVGHHYADAVEGVVWILMNPFVICLSTAELPDMAKFRIEDIPQQRQLRCATADDSYCIDGMTILLNQAWKASEREMEQLPESLLTKIQNILDKERSESTESRK